MNTSRKKPEPIKSGLTTYLPREGSVVRAIYSLLSCLRSALLSRNPPHNLLKSPHFPRIACGHTLPSWYGNGCRFAFAGLRPPKACSRKTCVINSLHHCALAVWPEKVGRQLAFTFGMRGPSLVTTVNSSSTPLVPTGKADSSFLAVLAEASVNGSFGNSAAGPGTEEATEENTANAGSSTHQGEQLPVMEATRANREASTNEIRALSTADQSKVL